MTTSENCVKPEPLQVSDPIADLVDWQMAKQPPKWRQCPSCRTGWNSTEPAVCPACGEAQ